MTQLLYEELTYKIRGILYTVHQELGSVHKEVVYQKALAHEFALARIPFQREKGIPVMYKGTSVGIYRPDFIIDQKVILEVKASPFFSRPMFDQIYYYIRGTSYRLVLLANFGAPRIQIIRRIF